MTREGGQFRLRSHWHFPSSTEDDMMIAEPHPHGQKVARTCAEDDLLTLFFIEFDLMNTQFALSTV